ncbi:TIR-like protein FxsC [Streptomyces sp. NPDC006923]|uniref:TIR-like protein FxsC n=1 Tax=Streptomyces sp. NPDC006923 TaxID=3155355 RepID=UPI003411A6E4
MELFLSFSGDDNENDLVSDFFEDLCQEIIRITTLSRDHLGYNYAEMRAAMKWRRELSEALGSCKVFIPLYSPRYFASEFCGKEWWAFSQRLEQYAASTPAPEPNMIFPVIWEGVFHDRVRLPKTAADIWARQRELGERYAKTGLRQLVQLKHHRDYTAQYHEIIYMLGERVAGLINESPLTPDSVSSELDDLYNAFADPEIGPVAATVSKQAEEKSAVTAAVPGPPAFPSGPKHVRLVVASGTSGDLGSLRQDTSHYGARQDDWAPYTPDAPEPVLIYAAEVATELRLVPHPEEFDDEVAQLLDKAEANNELAVIILDPWTVAMDHRQAALEEYDKRLSINAGMVVPESACDSETTDNADALRLQILHVLGRHARARQPVFKMSLDTVASFKDALRELLIELCRLLVSNAPHVRPAVSTDASATFIPRAFLSGPSEA